MTTGAGNTEHDVGWSIPCVDRCNGLNGDHAPEPLLAGPQQHCAVLQIGAYNEGQHTGGISLVDILRPGSRAARPI